ncbi:MAG: hypothetical protein Q8Q33_10910 [Chlamydiota bacterium]|nr:hypothetical protein [Chlamydiota bacterium]
MKYLQTQIQTLAKHHGPLLAQYFNISFDTTSSECPFPADPSGPDFTTLASIQIEGNSINISLQDSPAGPLTQTGTIQSDGSFQVSVGPFDDAAGNCPLLTTIQITGIFTGASISGTFTGTYDIDNSDPDCSLILDICTDPFLTGGSFSGGPA